MTLQTMYPLGSLHKCAGSGAVYSVVGYLYGDIVLRVSGDTSGHLTAYSLVEMAELFAKSGGAR